MSSSYLFRVISEVYACLLGTFVIRHLIFEKGSRNLGFPTTHHVFPESPTCIPERWIGPWNVRDLDDSRWERCIYL